MRRPPPLSIDANLANDGETPTSTSAGAGASGSTSDAPNHPIPMTPYLLSDTLRTDGMSIGFDYFRFEGRAMSFLSPSQLELEGTIGRGYSSVVRLARTVGNNDSGVPNRDRSGDTRNDKVKYPNVENATNDEDVNEIASPAPSASSSQPLHVALKTSQIRNRSKRQMMIKELRVLCRLDCDCLVQLIGAFVDEGMITTVLEYMDRGSLADMARHHEDVGGIPRPQLASIAYQMLWGLAFLHHENLLHRDIKPGNALLNTEGYVKLSDFGISADQSQKQILRSNNASKDDDENDNNDAGLNTTLIGTWRYMSPERLRGKPYGTPSDVWSLGLVLLECAMGTFPFHDVTSPYELIETIEESTMEDLIPISIDEDVRELIASCLRKNAAERVPAERLLKSPWFAKEGICSVDDATEVMKSYYDELEFFVDGKL